MTPSTIDHVALPCFDVRATHWFCTEVLGCPLVYAISGSGEAWGVEEYLLLARLATGFPRIHAEARADAGEGDVG